MPKIGTRTIIDKVDLQDEVNGDPVSIALREVLQDGLPLESVETELRGQEIKIKVQRLDRTGRILAGVALTTDKLDTLFDEVLNAYGPGRYRLFVNYRKAGSDKKPGLVVIPDLRITDPESIDVPLTQVGPAPQNEGGLNAQLIPFLLQSMAESNKLMISGQQQMTQILTALITKQQGGSSDILDAIQTGVDIAKGGGDSEGGEEDPLNKLIDFGAMFLKAFQKDPNSVNPDMVRKVAEDTGVDLKGELPS